MTAHANVVTSLNPKVMIFVEMATVNSFQLAFLASAARRHLKQQSVQWAVNRTGGSLLIKVGIFAFGWRRAAG